MDDGGGGGGARETKRIRTNRAQRGRRSTAGVPSGAESARAASGDPAKQRGFVVPDVPDERRS